MIWPWKYRNLLFLALIIRDKPLYPVSFVCKHTSISTLLFKRSCAYIFCFVQKIREYTPRDPFNNEHQWQTSNLKTLNAVKSSIYKASWPTCSMCRVVCCRSAGCCSAQGIRPTVPHVPRRLPTYMNYSCWGRGCSVVSTKIRRWEIQLRTALKTSRCSKRCT